jgi:NADH-quinone oxidoreductase subunit G
VNEEWISDKTRHVADGLSRQRLDRPYLRVDGRLRPVSWNEALGAVAERLRGAGDRVAGVAGDLVSVEPVWALKQLLAGLGSARHECRQDGAQLPIGNRAGYAGTARIEELDGAERIVLIGTNPRAEAPVLNARIRKAWLAGCEVGFVGEPVDLTYGVRDLGRDPAALRRLIGSDAPAEMRGKASIVVVGQGALARPDGAAVLGQVMKLCEEAGAKLLVLHTAAARVGALDAGFAHEGGLAGALDGAEVIYNLGADEVDLPQGPFVIYQGHHGDRGAHRADAILPGAAYPEQQGIYVNTEGRPQMALRAGFPPGEAKEDWAILRALSGALGQPLPFDSLAALRARLFAEVPHLGAIDQVPENAWRAVPPGDMGTAPFRSTVEDHYLTNPIARSSPLMAEMSRLARERMPALAAE